MFDEKELYFAICGVDILDFSLLKKTVVYDDGYDEEN